MGVIKQHIKDFTTDRRAWLLMVVFFGVQAVLFYQTGMVTTLEAEKYIREGTELAANGNLTETRFVFYLPVILLVSICRLLHLSLYFVIIIQVLFSAISLYCFYRVAAHLSTKTWALGVALLLAVCVPVQQWNMYVYSDSLFISLSVIFFSALYFSSINKTCNWKVLLIIPVVWCFARPAGLLFVLPMFVLLFTIKRKQKWILFTALGALLFMIIAASAYFNGGGDLDTLKPYIEEHIICFVPQNTAGANLYIVHTGNQLNDLFYYILHNPGHFISLLAQKLVSFFNLTRPWYSLSHNIAMVLLMLPVYLFFIPGIIRLFRTHRSFAWFVISVLFIYPVGVVLQCDDWHNRFTMPVFPLMMLTAFYGLYHLVHNIRSKK